MPSLQLGKIWLAITTAMYLMKRVSKSYLPRCQRHASPLTVAADVNWLICTDFIRGYYGVSSYRCPQKAALIQIPCQAGWPNTLRRGVNGMLHLCWRHRWPLCSTWPHLVVPPVFRVYWRISRLVITVYKRRSEFKFHVRRGAKIVALPEKFCTQSFAKNTRVFFFSFLKNGCRGEWETGCR